MKLRVTTLSAEDVGEVELPDDIFGLEPRKDILHRVVRWQLAKRRQGTHKAKTRSEGNYSGRKVVQQKRTGSARHGDRNAPIFRKGGAYKGPVPRSHAHGLPKRIRKLGLRHALSAKAGAKELVVLKDAAPAEVRTANLVAALKDLGWKQILVIDGPEVNQDFLRAGRNLKDVNIIPGRGANVYDILRHRQIAITLAGIAALEERLS